MADEEKLSMADKVGIAVIVLILLFFPYTMITQHQLDDVANSYYHNGR